MKTVIEQPTITPGVLDPVQPVAVALIAVVKRQPVAVGMAHHLAVSDIFKLVGMVVRIQRGNQVTFAIVAVAHQKTPLAIGFIHENKIVEHPADRGVFILNDMHFTPRKQPLCQFDQRQQQRIALPFELPAIAIAICHSQNGQRQTIRRRKRDHRAFPVIGQREEILFLVAGAQDQLIT
ncbi:Uncharacterised protein [Yersinia pseudotuberculosis]|nr:Uncharacterised protein [Yersinia pseudotuberculosis]